MRFGNETKATRAAAQVVSQGGALHVWLGVYRFARLDGDGTPRRYPSFLQPPAGEGKPGTSYDANGAARSSGR